MKITFLGSSRAVPEAHRKCPCIMFEIDENIYFMDMGCCAVDELHRRDMSIDTVKGIFITHMHGDHTDGLIQFVDLITWKFTTVNPTVVLPNLDAARVIDDWLKVTLNGKEKAIDYRQTKAGVVFDDGVLKVTAISNQHCPGSYSYVLEAEEKTVLYTGDIAHPSKDFPYVDKTLDLMICESAHFPATDYLPVLNKQQTKALCITHYMPRQMKSLYEFKQLMADRNQPFVIATDDLEINL